MGSGLRRRGVVLPSVAVLLIAGSVGAYASNRTDPVGYRTAVVGTGDVEQLLTLVGTAAYVSQASPHFRSSGTVSTVPVHVGDVVKAGQVLATLDTASLTTAVTQAVAALTKAEATLETDKAAASSSSSTTSTATATTGTGTTAATAAAAGPSSTGRTQTGSTSPGSGSSSTSATSAERAAEAALAQAQRALASAATLCSGDTSAGSGPSGRGASPSPTSSTSVTPEPSSSAEASASPTATASLPSVTSTNGCGAALQKAVDLQGKAAAAQKAVGGAIQSAATAVTSTVSSTPTSTPSTSSSSGASSGSTSSAPASSSGGGGTGGGTSAAARVITDTAAVAAAQTTLDLARADLAGAVLTSPIAGTVASLPYVAGGSEAVSDHATLFGPGAVTVTVNVPLASVRSVKVGEAATVLADGSSTPVPGSVSAVALLPTSSTTGTTTYAVTVLVPAAGSAFLDGGSASVSVVVATVKDVVTVPNSALTNGTVLVMKSGKPVRTKVTTGTKGALATEITAGLVAGQEVVLADLSKALPTSSTTLTAVTGNGGPGGNGGPPPGFAGGGFNGTGGRPGG